MPITNITHNACRYTVLLGVSTKDLTRITLDNNYTAYVHIWLRGICCVYQKLLVRYDATIAINTCNHRQCWKSNWCNHRRGHIFVCHYFIVWKSNNAGEDRGESWNESLKSRYIAGGLWGLFEWYKRKTFCCAFVAEAILTMVAAATIVRLSPVNTMQIFENVYSLRQ